MAIKSAFIFVSLLLHMSSAFANSDEVTGPIYWAKQGQFDFCKDSKEFDFRNAYWLAAMSYYSYWPPAYLEQIVAAPQGKLVKIQPVANEAIPNQTSETYGLGWNGHVDYFTSSSVRPHSPKKYNDHYVSYFTAPLPVEACIKREKQWCFGFSRNSARSQMEIDECGVKLEHTWMDRDRLRNIHLLSKGHNLDDTAKRIALRDQKLIENSVRRYEEVKKVDLGLDFMDPHFEDRCDIYRSDQDYFPDVQAMWMESSDLIILAIRGTEPNNIIDWTTDFATAFQLNHPLLPFWKRNVHKGYEQALEVMTDWLNDKVNQIFTRYPNAKDIPIFLTGHSMGGALSVLAMTSLLERNQKTSPDLKLNLKAVYTYGAPRVGNLEFAHHFESLNEQDKIGVYRFVNNKDVVTKAPCIDYTHFGSYIQLETLRSSNIPAISVDIKVNPDPSIFNYCAYGSSILDNVIHIQKYAKDHHLGSYYGALYTTRFDLNHALLNKQIQWSKNRNYQNEQLNPFRYPNNCHMEDSISGEGPEYLNLNYQTLPFQIEKD